MNEDAAIADIYRAVATFSFTLLGLWWVVLQFRHDEWAGDPRRSRENFLIMLGFLLPASASLFSSISSDGFIWRSAFAATGLVGFLAVTVFATPIQPGSANALTKRVVRLVAAPVYGAMAVTAVVSDLPDSLGIELAPRELEGLLVAAIVVLGVLVAWAQFTAPVETRGGEE